MSVAAITPFSFILLKGEGSYIVKKGDIHREEGAKIGVVDKIQMMLGLGKFGFFTISRTLEQKYMEKFNRLEIVSENPLAQYLFEEVAIQAGRKQLEADQKAIWKSMEASLPKIGLIILKIIHACLYVFPQGNYRRIISDGNNNIYVFENTRRELFFVEKSKEMDVTKKAADEISRIQRQCYPIYIQDNTIRLRSRKHREAIRVFQEAVSIPFTFNGQEVADPKRLSDLKARLFGVPLKIPEPAAAAAAAPNV